MIELLRDMGYDAERRRPNLGHNQARMTFVARPGSSSPSAGLEPA
jgi:hypothetical protein